MRWNRKRASSVVLFVLVIGLFLLADAGRCRAQARPSSQDDYLLGINGVSSSAAPAPVIPYQPNAADAAASSPPQVGMTADNSGWHFTISPYLWFPGVHGTIGARDRDVSVHASPGDLLSHFRFGLMGAIEARYKRVVLPLDIMWVRLGDNKALPFPNLMVNTAKLTGSEFILTPKIGFRIIEQKKIKIDALTGFRYWHFVESLKFTPSNLNLNFSQSQNWVDPVVGGRLSGALSPKVGVIIAGDVGGWGTGSQLDYQVVGLLGYRIKPAWTLQAGYRYLDVNYRSGGAIIDLATSGVVFGVSITLK
jgi:hypothetical protein